jgi:hypothetical protein
MKYVEFERIPWHSWNIQPSKKFETWSKWTNQTSQQQTNQDTNAAFGKDYTEQQQWKYSQICKKLNITCLSNFPLWSTGGSTLLARCTETTSAILYHPLQRYTSWILFAWITVPFQSTKAHMDLCMQSEPNQLQEIVFDCLVKKKKGY